MARRLDKIEKEMGYCEIKLEKERRLRKQIEFLRSDVIALDRLAGECTQSSAGRGALLVRGFAPEVRGRPSQGEFLAAGLFDIVAEEREILGRELEDLASRLHAFTGFESKRTVLEEEKRSALKDLAPDHSSKMRRINEDFKKVERQWNSITEDIINLDEGIFFLDRNLDYLRSCRTFLISAKGTFDIESWLETGYLSDLFRHSSVGRAKEMADGADRNLKMAQKELVCVAAGKIRPEDFVRVLEPFLEALYADIFAEQKLERSLRVVEAALAGNLKLTEAVKDRRNLLGGKLDEIEKVRFQLFTRLGGERSSRLVG